MSFLLLARRNRCDSWHGAGTGPAHVRAAGRAPSTSGGTPDATASAPRQRVHLHTPTGIHGLLPLFPPREERAGERRAVVFMGLPSPQPSPHSSVVGRGSRRHEWW